MRNSLQSRYTVTLLLWILLVVTIVSSALFVVHRRSTNELNQQATHFITAALERQIVRQGLDTAEALASSVANALYHFDINAIRDLASTALQQSSVISVYVHDHTGTVVHDGTESRNSYGIQLNDDQIKHTLISGSRSLSRHGSTIDVSVPVSLGSRVLGGIRMRLSLASIAQDVQQETRTLQTITNSAFSRHILTTTIVAAVLALSGLILGSLVARNLSRPIKTLSSLTKHIARGQYDITPIAKRDDEIGELGEAFQHMAKQLRETTVSKVYVDNILQSMDEMLLVVDARGRIETANRATLNELRYSEQELLGKPLSSLLPGNSGSRNTIRDLPSIQPGATETCLLPKSGKQIPVYWSGSELKGNEGEHRQIVYVGRNISELKQAEEKLRCSLNEKHILLKEIHHRVKNNLQLISSLLSLQAQQIDDSDTAKLFRESENRVHTMALIHEQLYNSRSLANIHLPEYIHGLANHLRTSFGERSQRIVFHVDVEDICLPIDAAIPCGLLINELISNAIQHAFVGRQTGRIWIVFTSRQGNHCLSVKDNGIGLPEDCTKSMSTRLGLQLIHGLAKQLTGKLTVTVRGGTCFTLAFEASSSTQNSPHHHDLAFETFHEGSSV